MVHSGLSTLLLPESQTSEEDVRHDGEAVFDDLPCLPTFVVDSKEGQSVLKGKLVACYIQNDDQLYECLDKELDDDGQQWLRHV